MFEMMKLEKNQVVTCDEIAQDYVNSLKHSKYPAISSYTSNITSTSSNNHQTSTRENIQMNQRIFANVMTPTSFYNHQISTNDNIMMNQATFSNDTTPTSLYKHQTTTGKSAEMNQATFSEMPVLTSQNGRRTPFPEDVPYLEPYKVNHSYQNDNLERYFASMNLNPSEKPVIEFDPVMERFEKFFSPITKNPIEEFFKKTQDIEILLGPRRKKRAQKVKVVKPMPMRPAQVVRKKEVTKPIILKRNVTTRDKEGFPKEKRTWEPSRQKELLFRFSTSRGGYQGPWTVNIKEEKDSHVEIPEDESKQSEPTATEDVRMGEEPDYLLNEYNVVCSRKNQITQGSQPMKGAEMIIPQDVHFEQKKQNEPTTSAQSWIEDEPWMRRAAERVFPQAVRKQNEPMNTVRSWMTDDPWLRYAAEMNFPQVVQPESQNRIESTGTARSWMEDDSWMKNTAEIEGPLSPVYNPPQPKIQKQVEPAKAVKPWRIEEPWMRNAGEMVFPQVVQPDTQALQNGSTGMEEESDN